MEECTKCPSNNTTAGCMTTNGYVCPECLNELMIPFVSDLRTRLSDSVEVTQDPENAGRNYVYELSISGKSSEHIELRTNGEDYIVNYFISSDKLGVESVAKDFIQKPIDGRKPWLELSMDVQDKVRRLNYSD